MESQKKMMFVFGLVAALFLQSAAAQTEHVVGDSAGWAVPQSATPQDYITWASSQKFSVGDVLIFNYATNTHDVLEVPKAAFDACSSDNSIGSVITTGPANVTLTSPGEHYFICTVGRHCLSGQKLAVTVDSASTTSPPAASPTTTPTSTSPPPPTTTTTAPAGGPTESTTPGTTAALPPSSSPPAGGAGLVLCVLSLVMGLFF